MQAMALSYNKPPLPIGFKIDVSRYRRLILQETTIYVKQARFGLRGACLCTGTLWCQSLLTSACCCVCGRKIPEFGLRGTAGTPLPPPICAAIFVVQ